ncbi:MAG TPA: ABC transporter permease [Actinophytocola sp.]|uniref:ABC transporter permease n=1 Tax=Actinophytocola sp. TaxID=1872138 RepID=UPI002DDD0391|nr:ABC transporter permease [Actinophytocola sp.]HEV2779610.1 ABC transporter permease [Actinophytocola sp.]
MPGDARKVLRPTRLGPVDAVLVGAVGLRVRPLRVALAALGIAIGIAAMVAVVGISASSRAQLDRELAKLGTNLLTVEPGSTVFGEAAKLPVESVPMVGRIRPVRSVSATGRVQAAVYRNDHIPAGNTGGISVLAAMPDLLDSVGGRIGTGSWLNQATASYPAVVLGSKTARRLDIRTPGVRVWLGGHWFSVTGVLDPLPLAPELDNAALVGWAAARDYLHFDGHPTTIYCRSADSQVEAVRTVLPATVNPQSPFEVKVSRPSDALAAQRTSDRTLNGLLLGLGAVALLVGGVGVANTMVISVLERRGEIGLRRSLGAARGQIRWQFLMESLILSAIGGVGGVLLGGLVTASYDALQSWPVVLPPLVIAGGVIVTLPVGAAAGLYPAIRAARLTPTDALATL